MKWVLGILSAILIGEAIFALANSSKEEYVSLRVDGTTLMLDGKPVKFNGIKAEFTYEVRNKADGELYTTGKSSHCFVDEKLQLLNIKKSHPQVYELFLDPVRDTLGN